MPHKLSPNQFYRQINDIFLGWFIVCIERASSEDQLKYLRSQLRSAIESRYPSKFHYELLRIDLNRAYDARLKAIKEGETSNE